MSYTMSLYLLIFLPLVLLAYQLIPRKGRPYILLGASYAFFLSLSGGLILYLLGITLLTYGVGRLLARSKEMCKEKIKGLERAEKKKVKGIYQKRERAILVVGIVLLLLLLGYLKYYNFFALNANVLFEKIGSSMTILPRALFLPIGISYYTLEAIGYMTDVYWNKIKGERHIGKLALFLAFFPQIIEGPICAYADTADQLWGGEPIKSDNLAEGGIRIIWGMLKKIVVADRLNVVVNVLFNDPQSWHGVVALTIGIAYTIQLYMEFSGCMDIVIGTGKLFGVTLTENFRQPFFAKNASEFWRRWHITLGVWFRTYIFYPIAVSGLCKKWNQFAEKRMGKYVARLGTSAMTLFPVWLCNGLWHGADWKYIFYGMYYFCLILFENAIEPFVEKGLAICHIREDAVWYKTLRILKTWVIIFVGEVFFRAFTVQEAWGIICSVFEGFQVQQFWDGTLRNIGLERADIIAVVIGVIIVAVVDILKEKNIDVMKKWKESHIALRWGICYALIFTVVILGAYGAGYQAVDLIYAGF